MTKMFLVLLIAFSVNSFCVDKNTSNTKPGDAETVVVKLDENKAPDFALKSFDGKIVKLSDYKGKVVLFVNTASKCGQWYQMKDLQKIYERYKNDGLEVLGFPSNSFSQEPKSAEQIGEVCEVNFGVGFKMMQKNSVLGSGAQPVYKYLSKEAGMFPIWNFHKYLVDRNGKVVAWFNPWRRVVSATITDEIEKCLKERAVENKG